MFWVLLIVGGMVKKAMDAKKSQVAIFSADRKQTQGKVAGTLQSGTRLFGSKKQAGKVNTFSVGSTIGPQNPSGGTQ